MNQRKKRNSSKVNLTISAVFHTALILAVAYFAAREGMLGKKLKEITVTLAPKEKKPEPPKEKKVEPPKVVEAPKPPVEAPKVATLAAPPPRVETTAPPPVEAPAAAPAPVSLPAFAFSDGAKDVQSVSDPHLLYKGLVEHALRSRWDRPEGIEDEKYVAEVELSVDSQGNVTQSRWLKGSSNARWDASVKAAIAATKTISRPPPKGFPARFVTRFDVETSRTEDVMRLSSR